MGSGVHDAVGVAHGEDGINIAEATEIAVKVIVNKTLFIEDVRLTQINYVRTTRLYLELTSLTAQHVDMLAHLCFDTYLAVFFLIPEIRKEATVSERRDRLRCIRLAADQNIKT